MHARKVAPALVAVLFVALCGTTLLLNQHKASLSAQARSEIQAIYNSPLYAPGSAGNLMIRLRFEGCDYVDSSTIQQFSLQGDKAIVTVKHIQRNTDNSTEYLTPRVHEVTMTNRDEWQKVAGQWVSIQSKKMSSETLINGKRPYFAH